MDLHHRPDGWGYGGKSGYGLASLFVLFFGMVCVPGGKGGKCTMFYNPIWGQCSG
jgi:hypothetical protein